MRETVTSTITFLSRQPRFAAAGYVVTFVILLAVSLSAVIGQFIDGPSGVKFLLTVGIVTFVITGPAVLFAQSLVRDLRNSQSMLKALVTEVVGARDEAIRANHFKSEFLNNLSHELRTPLNSIIGFSQLLQKQSFGPLGDARYLGYVNDINLGGQHLLDLINDILALSKIESGSAVADEYVETNVDDVISDALHILMPLADQRGVSLEVAGPMADAAIVVSERMLRQILLNVLSNALKFTDRDGLVRIMVETRREGDLVVLVHDTGVGMSEEEISIALTPFGQVPNRADARGNPQGTGLGLPLVKAMMELQQGTVQIDSVPDDGTIVRLVFPASRVRAVPQLRRVNSH